MSARHISYWISRVIDVTGRKHGDIQGEDAPQTGIAAGGGIGCDGQSRTVCFQLMRLARCRFSTIAADLEGVKIAPSTPSAPSLKPVGNADDADV